MKSLDKQDSRSPPWPALTMLKCILPAKWFGLSDTQLEECFKDRLSFRRFVGLSLTDATPDQTTFVRFRARLREANLDRRLFDDTLRHLDRQSLLVKDGTLVDATIIEQSRGASWLLRRGRATVAWRQGAVVGAGPMCAGADGGRGYAASGASTLRWRRDANASERVARAPSRINRRP